MPDKKSKKSGGDDAGEEKKKSPIKKILPIVIMLVIGGAGYMMGGKKEPQTIIAEPVETKPYEEIHEIVALDPVNVNLAGGHYLRIAVALGLAAEEDAAAGEKAADSHGKATDEAKPSIETAPASDLVLTIFAGMEMEELQTPEGREKARQELLHALEEFYGEKIHTVLFTEFVMQ